MVCQHVGACLQSGQRATLAQRQARCHERQLRLRRARKQLL